MAHEQTLLLKACKLALPEIVQLLLENDANVNVRDKDGNTCLHHACKCWNNPCYNTNHFETVKLLVKYDKQLVSAENNKKKSLLHFASSQNHFIIYEFLWKNIANTQATYN